jgi:threonine dehydrogenase-like Zn-dependent dehydrogenase
MLAATYTQDEGFRIQEVPRPEIGADEILLRVRATSICGTDLKIVRHGHRKLATGQRIVLGHEFVGEIAQVGAHVHGYAPGQRVGVAPNAGCGRCNGCIRGQANYCPFYTAFGIDRDGSHADWVRIPAQFIAQGNVMPLPDSISDKNASLLEPLSCVVNGVRVLNLELGSTVVIFGAGPIGLMHLMVCRLAGAAQIIVIDPQPERLERARQLGCDVTIDPQQQELFDLVLQWTAGQGADAVITACPVANVQTQAVPLLAPFGRLCLFGGLPAGSGAVPLDTNLIHYKNLLVTGSTGGSLADYRIALKLVAGGRIDLTALISDTFPMAQLDRAYDTAMARPAGKVAILAESAG